MKGMKDAMNRTIRLALAVSLAGALGCISPSDARPGLWLSGDLAATPGDWSFSDQQREIQVQVRTPYLVPHSVTVWCATIDGRLYTGARSPETKNWPGWAERSGEVRLRIAGRLYDVRLERIEDADLLTRIRAAYARKYDLPSPPDPASPPVRYWAVTGRN